MNKRRKLARFNSKFNLAKRIERRKAVIILTLSSALKKAS
jgi:hypothetical protein